jgi:hypothetical protein
MLILQTANYAAGDIIVWIYAYAGTTSIVIPSMFLLCGIGLTAFFAVLSEMNFGDRFEDHFLTSYQAAANIILQLVFLLAAPEIGFLFLTVVFVIFRVCCIATDIPRGCNLMGIYGIRCNHDILLLENLNRPASGNNA